MSIDSRLQRVEQTLAGTSNMSRLADAPRITRRRECSEAFNAFVAANGFDPGTFRDFQNCLVALEAQRNGAAQ